MVQRLEMEALPSLQYSFMLKAAGQLEVVEEIVQPTMHGFQKWAEAGLGSPMRSIPKTSSSSNDARFSFAGGL